MIRQAVTNDLDVIANIEKSVFDNPYTLDTIKGDIQKGDVSVMVVDDVCVGFITVSYVIDEAELQRIAVSPLYRRNGYGTILLASKLDELKHYGIKKVFLEVRTDNVGAIGLYKKCGFTKVSIRKKYYSDGSDAIIMANNLEVQ